MVTAPGLIEVVRLLGEDNWLVGTAAAEHGGLDEPCVGEGHRYLP